MYLHYVNRYHVLNTAPGYHYTAYVSDDDEMDYTQAVEASIDKLNYLLDSLIKPKDVSKETSNNNEN